ETDDLTIATNFGGDVTGTYNNLQIGATTIGATELASSGVTAGTYGAGVGTTSGFYPILTIDEDGRITSASTAVFNFENPLTFSNGLTRTSNSVTLGGALTTDTRIYDGSYEYLFFETGNGAIGIGMTNPTYKLDVNGGLRVGGTAVFNTVPTISNNNVLLTVSGGVLSQIDSTNWDTNETDDLTIATNFGGDVTGTYDNLQLGTGVVGATELASSGVTAGTY